MTQLLSRLVTTILNREAIQNLTRFGVEFCSQFDACCDAVVRFSMKTVGSAYEFNRLLSSFGVPKDHRPTIKIPSLPAYLREPMPAAAPVEVERVPLEAYGI